jgi:hypothetical protein
MPTPGRHSANRLRVYAVGALLAAVAACGKDTVGPYASVEFITQPSMAIASEPIQPAVEVMVRGALGRPLSGTVTLALDPNPCGWSLAGTLTAEVIDSTARFGDLALDKVGHGYTLRASSRGASAVSEPFDVHSGIVTGPLALENVLCLEIDLHGDGESLTHVPEDDSFWIADDNREMIHEVDRGSGTYGLQITMDTILAALPDAVQCDDGDGDPNTTCSYVDNFELLTYDPAGRSMYVVNTVDGPTDAAAIFRLTKEACAGCFRPESWQPLPVGPSYRSIIVADGQMYLALGDRIYPYDYDTNRLATVDTNGDSLPPAYVTPRQVAGLRFDGTHMWILTRGRTLYQVEWATRNEIGSHELDPFGVSLPRGVQIVRDTIYVLEGDAPNPIYVLSQRQP